MKEKTPNAMLKKAPISLKEKPLIESLEKKPNIRLTIIINIKNKLILERNFRAIVLKLNKKNKK